MKKASGRQQKQRWFGGLYARLIAAILDLTVMNTLWLGILSMVYFLWPGLWTLLTPATDHASSVAVSIQNFIPLLLGYAVMITMVSLWMAAWISRTGTTPGKYLMRLHVVDATTGKPPSFLRAWCRSLASIVSLGVFAIGLLSILWSQYRQAWHDRWCHTWVLYR
jgi:uncharacterized RDD family membrane protein YckC